MEERALRRHRLPRVGHVHDLLDGSRPHQHGQAAGAPGERLPPPRPASGRSSPPRPARRGAARAPRGAGSTCRARAGRPAPRARAGARPRVRPRPRARPSPARPGRKRRARARPPPRTRPRPASGCRVSRNPLDRRVARLLERRPLGQDPVVGQHQQPGRLDRREVAERPGPVGADRVAVAERRRVPVVPVGDVGLHAAEQRLEAADEARLLDAPHPVADPAVVGVLRGRAVGRSPRARAARTPPPGRGT